MLYFVLAPTLAFAIYTLWCVGVLVAFSPRRLGVKLGYYGKLTEADKRAFMRSQKFFRGNPLLMKVFDALYLRGTSKGGRQWAYVAGGAVPMAMSGNGWQGNERYHRHYNAICEIDTRAANRVDLEVYKARLPQAVAYGG